MASPCRMHVSQHWVNGSTEHPARAVLRRAQRLPSEAPGGGRPPPTAQHTSHQSHRSHPLRRAPSPPPPLRGAKFRTGA